MRIPIAAYPAAAAAAYVVGRVVIAGGSGPASDATATPDAATATTAADDGWTGYDGSGAQFDNSAAGGVLQTPVPIPATSPSSSTPSKAKYLWATWTAGEVPYYGWKTVAGTRRTVTAGHFTTKGFSAEVRLLGNFPLGNGRTGTRSVYVIVSGAHAGKLVGRKDMAALVARYR